MRPSRSRWSSDPRHHSRTGSYPRRLRYRMGRRPIGRSHSWVGGHTPRRSWCRTLFRNPWSYSPRQERLSRKGSSDNRCCKRYQKSLAARSGKMSLDGQRCHRPSLQRMEVHRSRDRPPAQMSNNQPRKMKPVCYLAQQNMEHHPDHRLPLYRAQSDRSPSRNSHLRREQSMA